LRWHGSAAHIEGEGMKTDQVLPTDTEILEAVLKGLGLKLNPEYKDKWAKAILREINGKIDKAREKSNVMRLWQFEGESYVFSNETFEVFGFGTEDGQRNFSFQMGKEHFNIVNPSYTVYPGFPFNFYVSGFIFYKKKWNMVRLRFVSENYAEQLKADGNYTIKMRSWEKML
jgi:hypothetical protein